MKQRMNREKIFSRKQRMVPYETKSRHLISYFLANEHAQHSANKKQKQNNCYSFVTFLCALTYFVSTKLSLFKSYGLWKRNAGLDGDAVYFVVNQARWQDRDQKIYYVTHKWIYPRKCEMTKSIFDSRLFPDSFRRDHEDWGEREKHWVNPKENDDGHDTSLGYQWW